MRILSFPTFYEIGTNEYPGQCPLSESGQWPHEVPSTDGGGGPGTIDLEALAKLVEFFAARGYPILINFNYGTTFKGAYDDVEGAGKILLPILRKHGLLEREIVYQNGRREPRQGYWFHVDAALGAAYMPFLEMAHAQGRFDRRGPLFDFRLPCVNSLTMSGHKWIGAPWPCGVFMTRTKYLLSPPSRPNYIGSPDSTLAGSRTASPPLFCGIFCLGTRTTIRSNGPYGSNEWPITRSPSSNGWSNGGATCGSRGHPCR